MPSPSDIPQHVHPAIPAAAHLIPGIKDWLATTSTALSKASVGELKRVDWSRAGFEKWYAATDPLHSALSFAAGLTLFTFVAGEITNNASWVDRVWALLPLLYSAHFTFHDRWSGSGSVKSLFGSSSSTKHATDAASWFSAFVPNGVNERMFLVFCLQVLWSIRLHYNTLRRGFFDFSKEDYRWPVVRKWMPRWLWVIFDFVVVAGVQNILLLATALPQFLLLTTTRAYHPTHPSVPLDKFDFAIAGLFILNLIIEQTADSQQQAFQNWKHGTALKEGKGSRLLKGYTQKQADRAEGDLRRGFLTRGLWGWSRHPNFICEQLNFYILPLLTIRATVPDVVFKKLWSAARTSFDLRNHIYIFDAIKQAVPHIFNYSWLAALGMTSIFLGSTMLLTEPISLSKYPKYKQYQQRVGMYFPTTTIFKGIWLALTGRLSSVNEQVYGSGKAKAQ